MAEKIDYQEILKSGAPEDKARAIVKMHLGPLEQNAEKLFEIAEDKKADAFLRAIAVEKLSSFVFIHQARVDFGKFPQKRVEAAKFDLGQQQKVLETARQFTAAEDDFLDSYRETMLDGNEGLSKTVPIKDLIEATAAQPSRSDTMSGGKPNPRSLSL